MASICDLNKKPVINYPTVWEYKVIFNSNEVAQEIVDKALNNREYKLKFSKFSSDKKYASYNLTVKVSCEKERLELFNLLKKQAKYVL